MKKQIFLAAIGFLTALAITGPSVLGAETEGVVVSQDKKNGAKPGLVARKPATDLGSIAVGAGNASMTEPIRYDRAGGGQTDLGKPAGLDVEPRAPSISTDVIVVGNPYVFDRRGNVDVKTDLGDAGPDDEPSGNTSDPEPTPGPTEVSTPGGNQAVPGQVGGGEGQPTDSGSDSQASVNEGVHDTIAHPFPEGEPFWLRDDDCESEQERIPDARDRLDDVEILGEDGLDRLREFGYAQPEDLRDDRQERNDWRAIGAGLRDQGVLFQANDDGQAGLLGQADDRPEDDALPGDRGKLPGPDRSGVFATEGNQLGPTRTRVRCRYQVIERERQAQPFFDISQLRTSISSQRYTSREQQTVELEKILSAGLSLEIQNTLEVLGTESTATAKLSAEQVKRIVESYMLEHEFVLEHYTVRRHGTMKVKTVWEIQELWDWAGENCPQPAPQTVTYTMESEWEEMKVDTIYNFWEMKSSTSELGGEEWAKKKTSEAEREQLEHYPWLNEFPLPDFLPPTVSIDDLDGTDVADLGGGGGVGLGGGVGVSARDTGNCTEKRHRQLQNAVNSHCKTGGPRRCESSQSCSTLRSRSQRNNACLNARWAIQNECYDGKPDDPHKRAIESAQGAVDRCARIMKANKC